MKPVPIILTMVLALLVGPNLSAQEISSVLDKKFTIAELQEDFDLLQEVIETYHTGLYKYSSKEKLDNDFKVARDQINRPMNTLEFLKILMSLQKPIGNGHTEIAGSKEYYQERRKTLKHIPFAMHGYEGELFIYQNLSDHPEIQRGSKLISINGISVQHLLSEFLHHMPADGYNTSLPMLQIASNFPGFYAILKGYPEKFEVEIQSPDKASIEKYEVPPITVEEGKKTKEERYGVPEKSWREKGEKAITFSIEEEIALLTIRSFDDELLKKQKLKTKKLFADYFGQMEEQKVQHLIIDLRNNGGGAPQPTENLLAHLYDQPFIFYKKISSNARQLPKDKNFQGLGWGPRMLNKLIFKKDGEIFIGKKIIPGLKPEKPAKIQYAGQVYVLTNPSSFSATGEMTGALKNYTKAIFIGEEPGGNPVHNTSGIQAILTLPNTKNRAVIPFWLWEMNVDFENNGRGIRPDYPVSPTVFDRIEGKDRVLLFTKQMIKEGTLPPLN